MGATRLKIHDQNHINISRIAKVFAHPARVAILKVLSEQEGCCNDLVEIIGLSQATISQHLTVIGDAGLLYGSHKGKQRNYCLNLDRLEEFRISLNSFFNKTKSRCC